MEDQIREKLETIRQMLQQDGGDCELVKIDGKTVTLELKGACGSCPYAMETLKGYVQENLRETVDPEIVVERV
jgi:NifU-like protein